MHSLTARILWMGAAAALCLPPVAASGQPAPAAPLPAEQKTTCFARNLTRVETWRFFEPPASGGDPDDAFVANRLLPGLRHTRQRWEVVGA